MGTQQILLIVLSVIIVGVAIAVGISMFNNQAYNSNKTSIASDAQSFAAQVVQYWKTPQSQGGAGNDPANLTTAKIANFLGWTAGVNGAAVGQTSNENGFYSISAIDLTAGDEKVTVTGYGTAEKNGTGPSISTVITLADGTIDATPGDAGTGTFPTAAN